MNKQIFFISGGSGAGKSTVMDLVKNKLPHSEYHIHDMDEVGVPDDVDEQWRIEQTENWIKEGTKNSEHHIKNNYLWHHAPRGTSCCLRQTTSKYRYGGSLSFRRHSRSTSK